MKKKILCFPHHDTSIPSRKFDASTRENELAAFLVMLKEEYGREDSWLTVENITGDLERRKEETPDIPLETIEEWPESDTKASLLREWDNYKKRVKSCQKSLFHARLVERALKTNDGHLAESYWRNVEPGAFDTDYIEVAEHEDDINKIRPWSGSNHPRVSDLEFVERLKSRSPRYSEDHDAEINFIGTDNDGTVRVFMAETTLKLGRRPRRIRDIIWYYPDLKYRVGELDIDGERSCR